MSTRNKLTAGPGLPKKKEVRDETDTDGETETESETEWESEREDGKGKAAPTSSKARGGAPDPKTKGQQSRRGSPVNARGGRQPVGSSRERGDPPNLSRSQARGTGKASETESDSASDFSSESSEDEKRPQKTPPRPSPALQDHLPRSKAPSSGRQPEGSSRERGDLPSLGKRQIRGTGKASDTESDSASDFSSESSEDEKRPQKTPPRATRSPARASSALQDRSRSAPPFESPAHQHTYPPSSQKLNEEPEKKRGNAAVRREDWEERIQKLHPQYQSHPPIWDGACGDCARCWKGFWGWWLWRWLVRKMPYLLSMAMIISAGVVAASGDMIGVWVVNVAGVKYGGMGYCEATAERCETKVMYNGPTAGSWPAFTLPALLLSLGLVGLIQLLLLIYCYLFVRHNFQSCCCADIEAQNSNRRRFDARPMRALVWFERTMALAGLGFFITGVMLVEWVSEADGEGMTGYSLVVFLLISPFIWFGLRMSYRSSWAYDTTTAFNSASKTRKKTGDKWDETYMSDDEGQLVMRDPKGKNVRKPKMGRATYD